jgi:hypothetical protein
MKENSSILKYSFFAGCAYFFCIAFAHFFGLKIPGLYFYYDGPFYEYRDKLISFTIVAYIGIFYLAAKNRSAVPTALIILSCTVFGLGFINFSQSLRSVLQTGQSTYPYWAHTGILSVYLLFLTIIYVRDSVSNKH